jgi:hypothetical protein
MSSETSQQAAWWFPRVWAGGVILLIAVTWPLWFATASAEYPLVSLLGPNVRFPSAAANLISIVLVGGLLAIVIAPVRFACIGWLVLTALIFSFVVDQHRLQPWAYQTAIYAMMFGSLNRREARRSLMFIGASVYLFSAFGKFDYQFLHTVGQDFLAVLVSPLGSVLDGWNVDQRVRLVAMFPATELLIGIGLLIPATRRLAAIAVMMMHITLIGILGPWGLNHSLGVLAWNGLLLIQGYLLFFRWKDPSPQPSPDHHFGVLRWAATAVAVFVIAAPLFERSGYWDHWLSWSLYSPHTSRLDVEVHQTAIDQLGDELRRHVQKDTDGDRWHRLALDQWSLAERGVPIYPQARYQLGLTVLVAENGGLKEDIRARLRSVSDRWTGERREERLVGLKALRSRGSSYWLWFGDGQRR